MFRVGQKVVCIDDSPGLFSGRSYVTLNAIYTIRGFCENIHGEIGLLLNEVRPDVPRLLFGQERGFQQSRFRPVVERGTDIGFAHEILRKANKKVPALTDSSGVRKSES